MATISLLERIPTVDDITKVLREMIPDKVNSLAPEIQLRFGNPPQDLGGALLDLDRKVSELS